jgi:hypothetical protein
MLDARTIRVKAEGDYGRLTSQIRVLADARTLPTQLAAYLEAIRLAERIRTATWVLGDEAPGMTEEGYWNIPKKLKEKLKGG